MQTHDQALQKHLDQADRAWFAAHPSAQWRKRRYIPRENAYDDEAGGCQTCTPTHAAVFRRADGSLVRLHFRAGDA